MQLKLITLFVFILFACSPGIQSQTRIKHLDPPHWWTDMVNDTLQLMVQAEDIALYDVQIQYPGVIIEKLNRTENPNYLFIDLIISTAAAPGNFTIQFTQDKHPSIFHQYPLKNRSLASAERQGFDQSDIIYLLMPDRFANGDPANDMLPEMPDSVNRMDPDARHGGDIEGIIQHIPYLENLGVSALWINPLLENNMPKYSYHGYATTDYYNVDARFGGNESYLELSQTLHSKNIKLIMDMVFNHCGSGHWWMKDLPSADWVHQFEEFTRSNYRAETVMDPYATQYDRKIMLEGWFDRTMPDLNQKNPFLANYLIQNSIWWIEEAGLDGIRMDTYPYADATFMNEWQERVKAEYPHFTVLGETWLQTEAHTAWFQQNAGSDHSSSTQLNYLTDFPTAYALNAAFKEKDDWTHGLARLYYTLSKDYLYAHPENLITFLDNHDLDRFFSNQEMDMARWKMGMVFLLSSRGIPMIYYGTEYLAKGAKIEGDGSLRKDVPGGWDGDDLDIFSQKNLSPETEQALAFFKQLTSIRRNHPALQKGELKHFFPEDGIYVYFRLLKGEKLMIILNNNTENRSLDTKRFNEFLMDHNLAIDLLNHKPVMLNQAIPLTPKSAHILKLQ